MLNLMRDKKKEGTYRGGGGEGTAPVTTAAFVPKNTAEGQNLLRVIKVESEKNEAEKPTTKYTTNR